MPFPWKGTFITSSSSSSNSNTAPASVTVNSGSQVNVHHHQPNPAAVASSSLGHGFSSGIISSVGSHARKLLQKKSSSSKDTESATSSTSHHNTPHQQHHHQHHSNQQQPQAQQQQDRHPSGERIEEGKPVEYARLKSTIRTSPSTFKSKLVFHCQLAHGSPTGLISGFNDIYDLYQKMADCYDISVDDILFCTLNTHKVDVNHLLGAQLALDDFIFIHLKGQKKEVEVEKTDSRLGVTITDNGIGKTFIKRIKPDTVFGRMLEFVHTGDHIEKINDQSMIGKRHFEVAKLLRDTPVGEKFTLRLIEPLKAAFSHASSSSSQKNSLDFTAASATTTTITSVDNHHNHHNTTTPSNAFMTNGVQTIRFKSKGAKVLANIHDNDIILERLNNILETFMGISDKELAYSILEIGKNILNPKEFTDSLRKSEFADFEIPDDVAFDLWGAIKDHRDGRFDQPTVSGYSSTKL